MNRLSAAFLLVAASFAAAQSSNGQSNSPHVEKATSHTTSNAARVAPLPQHLFGGIPLSTHSEEARKFAELSLDKYENALLEDAVVNAKHATEKDPQFALGFALLAFESRRGEPDAAARARAKALLSRATPEEKLLVRWMTNVEGHDLLPAISSMNDLLKRFPKDKHVVYLTAEWLYFQQDYERSRDMMEQVLRIDPDFPPALNMLGYSYIETGDPDPARALAMLKRYAEVQSSAPNPEDSLGEVSRFAGDDSGSLKHYAAALQIDPLFFTSQLGLGDTLTLMGKFNEAREEYDRAIKIAETPRDVYHAKYQRALVYFWEGKPAEGRQALTEIAEESKKANEPYAVFEISLGSAMLALNSTSALDQLHATESFLQNPIVGMGESDRGAGLAAVLREEVRIATRNGQTASAEQNIAKLERLAATSQDLVVEDAYESARGYLLFAQEDFANAADELASDPHSPLALEQLAVTQNKLGNFAAEENTRKRLKYQRAPIVEWYLVMHNASTDSD